MTRRREAPKTRVLHFASSRHRIFVVCLLASGLLAGCTSDEPTPQTNAIAPGIISGVVTDAALIPIAGVNVTVDGANASALTDAAGAFSFSLLPGEYVVLAEHVDYKGAALRSNVMSDQTSTLAFQLELIPRVVPRVDVAEAQGYLACEALVVSGGDRHVAPCGDQDPNAQPAVEFGLLATEGLEDVVVELVWEAGTQAASVLRIDAEIHAGDAVVALGSVEGISPLALAIPGRLMLPGTLVVRAMPAGSFTDEEAGADVGVVVQQGFTVYASSFYWAGAPSGYSALDAGG